MRGKEGSRRAALSAGRQRKRRCSPATEVRRVPVARSNGRGAGGLGERGGGDGAARQQP